MSWNQRFQVQVALEVDKRQMNHQQKGTSSPVALVLLVRKQEQLSRDPWQLAEVVR